MVSSVVTHCMNRFEVVYDIAENLSLAEVALARGVNFTWMSVGNHRLRIAFDQQRLLSMFFNNAVAFLSLMARHDVVLGGLPILDMFDERRTYDQVPCLEVTVEATKAPDIERFLVDAGYTRISRPPHRLADAHFVVPDFTSATVHWMLSLPEYLRYTGLFVREIPSPHRARAVCVKWSSHSPAITITNLDHLRMTFMTSHRVFCIFPVETLLQHRSWQLQRDTHAAISFDEYRARGYELRVWVDGPEDRTETCLYRHFGDADTWTVNLLGHATDGVAVSGYRWDLNAFKIVRYRASGPHSQSSEEALFVARVYSCPLVHDYLASDSYSACFEFRHRWYSHLLLCLPVRSGCRYDSRVVTETLVAVRSEFAAELASTGQLPSTADPSPRAADEGVVHNVDMVD